jgi:hypothetical protein
MPLSFKETLAKNVAQYFNTYKKKFPVISPEDIFAHIEKNLRTPGTFIFSQNDGITRLKLLAKMVESKDDELVASQTALFLNTIKSSTSIHLKEALLTTFQEYYKTKIVADEKEVKKIYDRIVKAHPDDATILMSAQQKAEKEALNEKTYSFIANLTTPLELGALR